MSEEHEENTVVRPYQKRKRIRRMWKNAVGALACIVVFCTVYALILPAITADYKCRMEEHTHSRECYRQISSPTLVMQCSMQSLHIHSHTPSCYDAEGNLICGYADYVIHTHNESCYDMQGNLVCPLPEIREHIHTESCYAPDSDGEAVRICGKDLIQAHVHTGGCYDENGRLACGKLETYEHTHSDNCFSEAPLPLTCTLSEDENHIHTDLCYGEWELICGIPEHTHTEQCYKTDPLELDGDVSDTPANIPDSSDPASISTETAVPEDVTEPSAADEPTAPEDVTEPSAADEPTAPEDVTESSVADEPQTVSATPIDVSAYIDTAKLKYKLLTDSDWKAIDEAIIPGNAQLRLEATYDKVSVTELRDHGRQLVYTIPPLLRNPVAEGAILDAAHQEIGVVTVSGNVLTMTFDEKWLQGLIDQHSTEVSGSFSVESTINLSEIPGGGETALNVGGVILRPNFEEDLITKYGDAKVKKAVSSAVIRENGQDYLEYTLTLTAGPDGCIDVMVVDHFTANQQVVAYDGLTTSPVMLTDSGLPRESVQAECVHGSVYKGAQPTTENPIPGSGSTEIAEPGSLVWVVNNMKANEVRTLTYRVRLLDGYTHLQNTNQKAIQNDADVYSGREKRDTTTTHFEPHAGLNMHKSHTAAKRNSADGSYTINYTVWIKAYEQNNFNLENVRLTDSLHHQSNPTDPKALPYISYVDGSFHLYPAKTPTGEELTINGSEGPIPSLTYGETKKDFTLSVGHMEPGQAYCLQYAIRVGAEVFGAGNPEKLVIHNRAIASAENASNSSIGGALQAYNDKASIDYQHWAEKTAGNRLEQAEEVSMSGGNVYDVTSGVLVEDPNPPASFPIPAGSYQYTVAVNDLGDWDISQATIRDQLQSEYMEYTGYVRVDAYHPNDPAHSTPQNPVETRWVKVDRLSQFSFSMAQIGLTDPHYAYQLTYFASPVNTDGVSQVEVSNQFELSGEVGIGENYFILTGIQTEVSVVVQGGYSFEATKQSWYYEAPKTASGPWSKGALYWVLKVDGTEFRSGVSLKDYVNRDSQMVFYEDSLVGVYTGAFPQDQSFTDYANMDDAKDSGLLQEVPASNYTVAFENSQNLSGNNVRSDVIIRMTQTVPLGSNTSMYIVLKAAPTVLPEANRTSKTYTNHLSSSDNGIDWIGRDDASKTLYGGENILKELGKTFTYDGTNIQSGQVDKGGDIPKNLLPGPGHYVSWAVKVNYAGNLAGRYRVVDQVPKGMEVAFARLKWLGDKISGTQTRMCQIPDYQAELGPGWTEHQVTANTDNRQSVTSYYYTNGNQVLWEVDPLTAGQEQDKYAVDFQIVCRVTDPDVLQGGQEATFHNRVELQTENGAKLDSDSNSVKLQVSTMSKEAVPEGSIIPFTVQVNPLGEDLVPGNDTIVLVDEMSSTLRLDPTTIQVVRTKDNTAVEFQAAMHENALWITLPDNEALTIRYSATVTAAPDEEVSISNHAYWQGYASSGGSSVEYENYSYKVSATAGGDTTPTISVKKIDQYNLTQALSGAVFELQEGTMTDGNFTSVGEAQKRTTDETGTAKFGASPDLLSYNTVYRITELQAPDGYVLDPTPHYVLVAQKNADDTYPDYPEGVEVYYDSSDFVLKATNRKGEAYVEKKFQDMAGNPVNVIDGTYRFGIYTDESAASNPLQIVTLTFHDGTAAPKGTFINLELNRSYYIYELDDEGNPIRSGETSISDGRPFKVSYANGEKAGNVVQSGETVTVTNQLRTEDLPMTGGHGTLPYTMAGLALLCSGVWLLYQKQRHRRGAC